MKTLKLVLLVLTCMLLTSCEKYYYQFLLHNNTDSPVTVTFTGCGDYAINNNGEPNIRKNKNQDFVLTIKPQKYLAFNYYIPLKDNPSGDFADDNLLPMWHYISEIKVNETIVDESFWKDEKNWDINTSVGNQTTYQLDIKE